MVGRWEGRSLVLGLIVRELALAERISETAPELFAGLGPFILLNQIILRVGQAEPALPVVPEGSDRVESADLDLPVAPDSPDEPGSPVSWEL